VGAPGGGAISEGYHVGGAAGKPPVGVGGRSVESHVRGDGGDGGGGGGAFCARMGRGARKMRKERSIVTGSR